jgi:hypothetical protein
MSIALFSEDVIEGLDRPPKVSGSFQRCMQRHVPSKPLDMFSTETLEDLRVMKTRSQYLERPSRFVISRTSLRRKMYRLLFFLRFSSHTKRGPSLK